MVKTMRKYTTCFPKLLWCLDSTGLCLPRMAAKSISVYVNTDDSAFRVTPTKSNPVIILIINLIFPHQSSVSRTGARWWAHC